MEDPESRQPKRKWIGNLALAVLVLNVVVFLVVFFGVGDGVDAGLGLAFTILFVTLPLIGVSLVLGWVGVVKRSGTVLAAVVLGINAAVLAVGVHGFVSTQMFRAIR